MPALSFMKQFCPRVENGSKTHSLRAKRKRAWKIGDKAVLYFAMRTKHCRLLGRSTVVKVEDVLLLHPGAGRRLRIRINGEWLSADEAKSFARRDGFASIGKMLDFWMEKHQIHHTGSWQGDVIHWKFPFEKEANPV